MGSPLQNSCRSVLLNIANRNLHPEQYKVGQLRSPEAARYNSRLDHLQRSPKLCQVIAEAAMGSIDFNNSATKDTIDTAYKEIATPSITSRTRPKKSTEKKFAEVVRKISKTWQKGLGPTEISADKLIREASVKASRGDIKPLELLVESMPTLEDENRNILAEVCLDHYEEFSDQGKIAIVRYFPDKENLKDVCLRALPETLRQQLIKIEEDWNPPPPLSPRSISIPSRTESEASSISSSPRSSTASISSAQSSEEKSRQIKEADDYKRVAARLSLLSGEGNIDKEFQTQLPLLQKRMVTVLEGYTKDRLKEERPSLIEWAIEVRSQHHEPIAAAEILDWLKIVLQGLTSTQDRQTVQEVLRRAVSQTPNDLVRGFLLYEACRTGDTMLVQNLLTGGLGIDRSSSLSVTVDEFQEALRVACRQGPRDLVATLLRYAKDNTIIQDQVKLWLQENLFSAAILDELQSWLGRSQS